MKNGKNGCNKCPNKKEYPISWGFDCSRENYNEKKKWFLNLPNLKIIVPSEWMKELVGQSFFKEYPIYVISNGINRRVFFSRKLRIFIININYHQKRKLY